jgi:ADP-ribose pyrophosphatase YjhB (NUDIX family)
MTPDAIASIFAAEIDGLAPLLDLEVQWPAARLRERVFIGDAEWPAPLATSGRCVVFKGANVLVVRQRDGQLHIRPGGRLAPGETLEAAIRRELLEETGWTVGPLTPLGFHHFQHLGARPADFQHVWRDFIQPIFIAEAAAYDRAALDRTQLEVGSRLTPVRDALVSLPDREALLLRAAIERRRSA